MAPSHATPRADTARATGNSDSGHTGATAPAGASGAENYSFSISTGPSQGTVVFTDDSGSYVYQFEKTLDSIFGEKAGERLFDENREATPAARAPATYVWERAGVVNADGSGTGLDHIADFGAGDRLDFTGLVAQDLALHDAIRVTDTACGLVVAVDVGGASGFVDIVVLDNVHGLTVDDLADSGAIAI